MKKILLKLSAVAVISLVCFTAAVWAAGQTKSENAWMTVSQANIQSDLQTVTGSLPRFESKTQQALAAQLNQTAARFHSAIIADSKGDAPSCGQVNFSYACYENAEYFSVVIHGGVSFGNTWSDKVKTMVVSKKNYKLLTLKDILGDDAYEISRKQILEQMARTAEDYLEDATVTVDANRAFYMDERSTLRLVFDKYEITPGYRGTVEFVIAPYNT